MGLNKGLHGIAFTLSKVYLQYNFKNNIISYIYSDGTGQ